jgi:hypothetical protein
MGARVCGPGGRVGAHHGRRRCSPKSTSNDCHDLAALLCCPVHSSPLCCRRLRRDAAGVCRWRLRGDTITVLDETNTQHKIRLAGIDAPEKKQPFGNRAKQKMSDLVHDKEVSVAWAKVDRYAMCS